ncbi:MAG: putative sulfate exporter family transporter [Deltaproteobacteria bacterium]|nr:putative sulfate exporter family transporter [Deltaproteobacteria bacterium]MBW2136272.1 putative sulfate exporter family transporter [Deltaproteobacteria bacterium]
MSNGNGGLDWSSLWRKEDWWSCWIGWFILVIAIIGLHEVAAGKWAVGILPHGPKIGKNWTTIGAIFPKGGATVWAFLVLFIFSGILTLIGGAFMKLDLKRYIPGYFIIFLFAYLSMILANQKFFKTWGIAYVIFALAFGLIISNIFKVPQILRAAGQTEFFIKIGLVCMGAGIFFSDVLRGGFIGLIQALVVATSVWFMTYWICRKFGVSERFSSIIATANSICGVSATIAAGGAIQGDKKEVSYMIAWVLVCAVVLIIVMPPIAKWLDLPNNWAGAWVGGVIDNTGAVVAAGGIIGGEAAYKVAAMVKMAQNVLIGIVAFLLALWSTLSLDRMEGAEKPSFMEIWYRFPKFVVGFLVASLVVSFIVEPASGYKAAKAIGSALKTYRNWFFALCFVSIGLETNFKELVSVGGGRPAAAYWISQTANAIWTLFVTWILWSGTFFTPVIPAD